MQRDQLSHEIGEYVKNNYTLLSTSVKNLIPYLEKIMPPQDYIQILDEAQDLEFWAEDRLKIFYDHYINYWNEKRLLHQKKID